MFASKTLKEHLVRGVIGFGALALLVYAVSRGWPLLTLALLPVALLALRGCPMCWTLGLLETAMARARRRPTEGLCADGRCARPTGARR